MLAVLTGVLTTFQFVLLIFDTKSVCCSETKRTIDMHVYTVQAGKVWHKLTQSGVLPFMTQHLGQLTDVARYLRF